jgi:hypothetical protein
MIVTIRAVIDGTHLKFQPAMRRQTEDGMVAARYKHYGL